MVTLKDIPLYLRSIFHEKKDGFIGEKERFDEFIKDFIKSCKEIV